MIDTISRQAVLDMIRSEPYNEPRYPDWWIDKISKIDGKVGQWIHNDKLRCFELYICSNCGCDSIKDYNYCPNCGCCMLDE